MAVNLSKLLLVLTIASACTPSFDLPGKRRALPLTNDDIEIKISEPRFTKKAMSFNVSVKSNYPETICYESTEQAPFGISLERANSDVIFDLDDPGGHDYFFGGPPTKKNELHPMESLSFSFEFPLPLAGIFLDSSGYVTYKKGDLLTASGIQSFFDCGYPSDRAASIATATTIVRSPKTKPFRER